MAAITLTLAAFTIVTIYAIGQVPLNADDLLRLGLFFLMSLLYMLFFYSLSLALTLMTKNGRQAMLIAIIVWIIFAFVLPQIGDTMDMDNQLPGGFFSSMGLQTSQESQILSHFKTYETIRNGIEELSPLKHYERMSFALMNIKPGFDQMTGLQVVATKWIDLLGVFTPMIVLVFLSYGLFLKKENIY
ncbi:ABC transporter permease subunit [Eubacteriaceae bacterium ES2]|nr:ABC transporter permease subunit [Eubacteriaceae bacterium ES2]